MSGKFITLEGGEGTGKTTNIAFICEHLRQAGLTVVATREPGGTALGEALRGLLLDHQYQEMHADTELLMMFAARAQHIQEVILPALRAGQWVVCDRFTDATFAYQGGGRGIAAHRIEQLEQWVQGELRPDCTIVLDVSVETGMQRAGKRGALDRFETETVDFFNRIRATYLARAKQFPNRFQVVDAAQPLLQVQDQLGKILDQLSA